MFNRAPSNSTKPSNSTQGEEVFPEPVSSPIGEIKTGSDEITLQGTLNENGQLVIDGKTYTAGMVVIIGEGAQEERIEITGFKQVGGQGLTGGRFTKAKYRKNRITYKKRSYLGGSSPEVGVNLVKIKLKTKIQNVHKINTKIRITSIKNVATAINAANKFTKNKKPKQQLQSAEQQEQEQQQQQQQQQQEQPQRTGVQNTRQTVPKQVQTVQNTRQTVNPPLPPQPQPPESYATALSDLSSILDTTIRQPSGQSPAQVKQNIAQIKATITNIDTLLNGLCDIEVKIDNNKPNFYNKFGNPIQNCKETSTTTASTTPASTTPASTTTASTTPPSQGTSTDFYPYIPNPYSDQQSTNAAYPPYTGSNSGQQTRSSSYPSYTGSNSGQQSTNADFANILNAPEAERTRLISNFVAKASTVPEIKNMVSDIFQALQNRLGEINRTDNSQDINILTRIIKLVLDKLLSKK
jgi:hypothetical protein